MWIYISLQWRHNGWDSVSNHQLYDCILNILFRRRSKKTSKLRVTGLCAGNSPVTGEFPAQRASNDNVSIWWRHYVSHEFAWDICATRTIPQMSYVQGAPRHVLTHWPLGDLNTIFDKLFSSWFNSLMFEVSLLKLPADDCHWTSLMISQYWFR